MGASDLGYFGPGSVTWRIHSEPVAMVGGLRALLLQALHPDAMRSMYEKSRFQDDPWRRLQRTVGYVATISFAPRDVADAAGERVRAVHRDLGIDDARQLAWVHACLADSFLATARAAGLPVSRSDADAYLVEQVRAADLAGVPADLAPRTSRELADYFAAMRPRLALTDEAREAARYVLAPPLPVPRRFVVPARLGWTGIASLAVGLLPGWARRMYRLPPLPGTSLVTAGALRGLRGAVSALPEQYREGPIYRAAKARAAARAI